MSALWRYVCCSWQCWGNVGAPEAVKTWWGQKYNFCLGIPTLSLEQSYFFSTLGVFQILILWPLKILFSHFKFIWSRLKRFMSVFCILTFHLFWVNTPLCQDRTTRLCSKIARQISHQNEWFDNFFCIFVKFLNRHILYYLLTN